MLTDAEAALKNDSSTLQEYELDGKYINGFVEYIKPPVAVVIAGAGNDVKPLVEITSLLGWQTTVVDGRGTHAIAVRFPKAQRVFIAKPNEVLKKNVLDSRTVFLLMTHNYNYDLALLKELLRTECSFIGILGPKKKMDRMFDDLGSEGIRVTEEQRSRIYSPMGLEIGAETSEEIAISIVAEVKAVLAGRSGTSLKNKTASIHRCTSIPDL